MTSPLVVFRTDSSLNIGAGHIMRCMTLAEEIRRFGGKAVFICRELPGMASHWLAQNDWEAITLPRLSNKQDQEPVGEFLEIIEKLDQAPDWLVIDHYGIDRRWEKAMRNSVGNIMVIDDLADRPHECDLLLDLTAGRKTEDYQPLVPSSCRLLLGIDYALLRRQFAKERPLALLHHNSSTEVSRILIGFGGTDPKKTAEMALEALAGSDYELDVLIGSNSPSLPILKKSALKNQAIRLHIDIEDVAALMSSADIALGAGGGTTWERCCMGLPSLLIQTADNQEFLLHELAKIEAASVIGQAESLSASKLKQEIERFTADHSLRNQIGKTGSLLCDGLGAGRVLCELFPVAAKDGKEVRLRRALPDDMDLLYEWQKHPDTRRYSFRKQVPSRDEHRDWFRNRLNDPLNPFHIVLHDEKPAGVVRLDYKKMESSLPLYEISIYIDPDRYNKGLGKTTLRLIRMTAPESVFFARVLKQNTASIRLFENSGYVKEADGYYQRPSGK